MRGPARGLNALPSDQRNTSFTFLPAIIDNTPGKDGMQEEFSPLRKKIYTPATPSCAVV
jgi:hypothetical protein